MQVSNINSNKFGGQIKKGFQSVGEKTMKCKSFVGEKFDTFVSSKGKSPKKVKQIAVGAGVSIIGAVLIGIAIKNIVHKIKEKINEK